MIVPPLSELLVREQRRHYSEVGAISRFHAFMTAFEESGGLIDGVPYRLSGISVEGCVASFVGGSGDYFFDASVPVTKNTAPFESSSLSKGSQVYSITP